MEAGVNLKESRLTAGGAVDISALTGDAEYKSVGDPTADINKEVTIKSAGVVAGTYAESTDTITFTNNINVGGGSSIATVGDNTADEADITLTAADRTNFTDVATADTQGGVIGAAGTKLTNNFTRTNNIDVGGTVDSNYDANFDAGDSSVLNLTLKSNAFNKTAAPLATNPSISGIVTQTALLILQAARLNRSATLTRRLAWAIPRWRKNPKPGVGLTAAKPAPVQSPLPATVQSAAATLWQTPLSLLTARWKQAKTTSWI